MAYLLFFFLFAAGFGVVASSYSCRHLLRKRHAIQGLVGGPLALGVILFGAPSALAAFDLLPSS